MAYKDKEKEKAYKKDYNKAYRESHVDEIKNYRDANRDKMKVYRDANRDRLNANNKAYYESHKEQIKEKIKDYYESHRDEIKAYKKDYNKAYRESHVDEIKAYTKDYREAHKDEMKAYMKDYERERLKNDSLFAFKHSVRIVTANAFRRCGFKKNTRTEKLLGCTFEYLMKYMKLPKDFFTNRSNYHIDHIIPLETAKTEEAAIRLSHHTNLQILTAEENLAKSDKTLNTLTDLIGY